MRTPQVDWADWSFGPGRHPVQGAVQAGAAALAVTMVGDVSGWLPAGWPLAAGALLAVASIIAAAWQNMPAPVVTYRAVCCLAAGGWSSGTLAFADPWSRWPLLLLTTGVALAAVVGSGLAWVEKRTSKPDKPAPAPGGARDPLAREWQERLRRITRRQVTVAKAQRWDPDTGFTLHVVLPADGTTIADVKSFEAQLASAANLPPGCNVEVMSAGQGRRLCHIRVATVNALEKTRHLTDTSPLSITDKLAVGDHADRSEAKINLRYACCVLVGQTDSGKSNTLNVVTHQLARCTDALVWAIDCSGQGRYPAPWVRAWAEGRATRPVIDWAAATLDEAQLMTTAAINVINGRSAAYRQLMFEANDDKLPVSPQLPEIVILVDEFADLPREIKEALETISNTGRGAAVRVVSCVLRAIGTDISRGMIVQARERIAMRVSDETELQYLFDSVWSRGRFDPANMPHQGSGLLSTGAASPEPFRSRRLEPRRIDAASVELAQLRPGLDEVSVELADTFVRQVKNGRGERRQEQATDVYTGRWERMLPVMFPAAGRPSGPEPATATVQPASVGTATATRQEEQVDLDESAQDLERAVERARRAREEAEAEVEQEPEIEADFTVVEGWLDAATPPERPDWRVRVRQIVQEHRRDGIGPRAVWQILQQEGYGTAEQTVISRMRADTQAGVLAQPGGKSTPYTVGPRFTLEEQ